MKFLDTRTKVVLVVKSIAFAVFMGFVVAMATGAILSPERAAALPGGSFSSGTLVGLSSIFYTDTDTKIKYAMPLLTALSGILGWGIYVLIFA